MGKLVALLGIALAVGLGHPRATAALPTITADSATVNVGDTFTISISIADAVDLTSWQLDLTFDQAIVRANTVTEGLFMSSFGTTLFSAGVIDNASGLISLVTDSYVDLPPNPSGSGVLAEIEFQALAPGVSPLTLSDVFLNLADSGFEIVNGQVTVVGQVRVSEPGAVALLVVGLLAAGARWRVRGRAAARPSA